MNKEKIVHSPASLSYALDKSTKLRSSHSEASDTEDVNEANNLSADNSNISRSSLLTESIDLNDDDDDDESTGKM